MNGALAAILYLGLMPTATQNFSNYHTITDGKAGLAFAGDRFGHRSNEFFNSVNVTLYANLTLSSFSANSGNDIWGYVSPSGREYAIVGLNNKAAFVEVTNPASPDYFANVPHTSSTWADIKVYQNVAYVVTEASGTGIQVIDLSNIDNHVVTLVRTISSPGRNHNIAVDPTSGFLYTCGSHEGSGWTACFNLSTPLNPVQVGAASMTDVYQHDICAVTFTSGPNAGRQILFGSGESRGVEFWDVTNKNSPFLVARKSYANVGYNHQSWVSADKHYLYSDDELDENNFGILTRTLVWDISDIANPVLVNTFTTGLPTIDHNLYVFGGFIFESDYTSGVRIFDANDNATNPVQVGWFDTYPNDDSTSFNGTWSNYPNLPSGTLIVNDINRGLFVLDPSQATVRPMVTDSFNVFRGVVLGGNNGSLATIDGIALEVRNGVVTNPSEAPVNVTFDGTAPWQHASKMRVTLTGWASTPGLTRTVEMFDWVANGYVVVSVDPSSMSPGTLDVQLTNPDRFIQPGTRKVRERVTARVTSPVLSGGWSYSFDQVGWKINP